MILRSSITSCSLSWMLTVLLLGSTAGWADENTERIDALEALYEAEADKSNQRSAATEFEPKFEALAQELAGTKSGLRAELWVLRNHWWKRTAGTMEQAANKQARRLIADSFPDKRERTSGSTKKGGAGDRIVRPVPSRPADGARVTRLPRRA